MQPRLSRSPNERMIAGICGGLAAYFNIDPVIVRLIFVVLTLTSGIGLPIYLLLWIIMPRSASSFEQQRTFQHGQGLPQQQQNEFGQPSPYEAVQAQREVLVGQAQAQSQGRSAQGSGYRFDPFSGPSLDPDRPATGRTVNLGGAPEDLPTPYAQPGSRPAPRWRTLGLILIGIGGLILLEQFGIDMSLIFPTLLIVAGAILMRRKR